MQSSLRSLVRCFLVSTLVGCAHSQIVPFQNFGQITQGASPTNPEDVGIYRSVHPFASYIELGAISYRMSSYDLDAMSEQLRKDAAECGA